jgi:hypothetical protein
MSGYSGTPLARKLGVKPSSRIVALRAPEGYASLLDPLPDGVVFGKSVGPSSDIVHVFVSRRVELERDLAELRKKLRPDAALWVSWPKKASNVATDVTEDVVRALALPLGLVDIKVCAVDDVWSGLKLVIRKELRT